MQIRLLGPADLDALVEVRLRSLEQSPSAFMTTLEEERVRGRALFAETLVWDTTERAIFGAFLGPAIHGMIGIGRGERPKVRHKASIWGMHVDREHRSQGIGGRLLDAAVDHARHKMGVAAVNLTMESANAAARALYESRGFVRWGTEPLAMGLDGEYCDEDHLVLRLR